MAEDTDVTTRVLDWFGTTVTDLVDERPDISAYWLTKAFEVKRFQTRHLPERDQLPAGREGARVALEGVTGALEHPDEAVLTSIFMPTEIFQAMGLRPFAAEALSDFITGAHAEEGFVRMAEQRGVPETYCSFHKILLGAAAARVLAPPRLIANCSVACDANNTTFKWLATTLDSPHVYIDVPYEYDEDACTYVADQLRDLARITEETYERTLDVERLKAAVARSQATLDAMARTLPLRRSRYLANDMGLEMQEALALHLSLGTTDSLGMAEQMLHDLPHAETFDGLSIVWMHSAPYFSPPLQQMLDRNHAAQIVASDTCFSQVDLADWTHETEGDPARMVQTRAWSHDASEPWEAMAERLIKNTFNGPAQRRVELTRKLVELTGADGVICFCHWGCKETLGTSQLAKRELEAVGIPVLALDGDCCHRANNAEGQIATRVGAFLEMLRSQTGRGQRAEEVAREAR